jgi:3-oxoadipate enol-lactonase
VIEMQERAFELQSESEAEATEPESIDLSAVTARTLVGVGGLDKRDFHEIAERLVRELPDAVHAVIDGAGQLPSLERPEPTARLLREFLSG